MTSAATQSISLHPLAGLPEVLPGDDLAAFLCDAAQSASVPFVNGDVIVVAQKVVSKAEGARVALSTVTPSAKAEEWAKAWNKDARQVEVVLKESKRILRMERGILISETHHGFICANAGVDMSNSGGLDIAILLPENPDRSATKLRDAIRTKTGATVAVIIADSFGRPWRQGLTQVALGVAGLAPLLDLRGEQDTEGREMHVTVIAIADELASAADLVCGKTRRVPAALIRGYQGPAKHGNGQEMLRPEKEDLFR